MVLGHHRMQWSLRTGEFWELEEEDAWSELFSFLMTVPELEQA